MICEDKEERRLNHLLQEVEEETTFDALGFYTVDRSLLTSIVATLATYLIILVQMP